MGVVEFGGEVGSIAVRAVVDAVALAVADGHAVGLLLIAAAKIGLTLAAAFTTGGACLGHLWDPVPERCRSTHQRPAVGRG